MTGLVQSLSTYSGTWTPVDSSGAALTLTGVSANYTVIGNLVFAYASFSYPTTVDGTTNLIGGLPFTVANANYASQGLVSVTNNATGKTVFTRPNTTTCRFATALGAACTNAQLSASIYFIQLIYPLS